MGDKENFVCCHVAGNRQRYACIADSRHGETKKECMQGLYHYDKCRERRKLFSRQNRYPEPAEDSCSRKHKGPGKSLVQPAAYGSCPRGKCVGERRAVVLR